MYTPYTPYTYIHTYIHTYTIYIYIYNYRERGERERDSKRERERVKETERNSERGGGGVLLVCAMRLAYHHGVRVIEHAEMSIASDSVRAGVFKLETRHLVRQYCLS
jgi:hypothetical protein